VLLVGYTRPPARAGAAGLRAGVALELRREPHNPVDKNAIAVDVDIPSLGMARAGYVWKKQAERLAPALDAGQVVVVSATLQTPPPPMGAAPLDVHLRLALGAAFRQMPHSLAAGPSLQYLPVSIFPAPA